MAATFMARTTAREEEYAARPLQEGRPILAEKIDPTGCAASDHQNSGLRINRSADAVAALGGEDDSLLCCLLHLIDGLVKSVAVTGNSTSMHQGSI